MFPNKGINKISELKTSFTHCWVEPDFIKSSLKCFTFSSLCKALGPFKLRGYSFESIFTMLLSVPFLGVETVNSMYNHYLIEHTTIKKDVFYRKKNNPGICWCVILWLFACKFRNVINDKSKQDNGSPRCIIVDDSTLPKSGRLIEKVSYVWDHVLRRSILGFKLLVAGYWNGTSFIPIDAVKRVKNQNIHLIGMCSTPKTLFNYCAGQLTHCQIRNTLDKPKDAVNSICIITRYLWNTKATL